jgi:nitroreductase
MYSNRVKNIKELIKLVLSNRYVRQSRRLFGLNVHKFFSATYFLSIPASIVSPFSFMREQRAVRGGKASYYKNIRDMNTKSSVGLRRNIHRLEKALIMKPRRESFAKDYIQETVEWYSRLAGKVKNDSNLYDPNEIVWAENVLTEYFKSVKAEGVIKAAQDMFESVDFAVESSSLRPFTRSRPGNLPSYDQLLSLSEYRRSVRWFNQKKVDRKVIDKALLVARQSPTACNRMPYEFRIFDEPELVKKIANTPFGTGGYADNIPVIGVVVGKLDSYFSARDRHAIYVDSSLATMGFVYALESQGVSTCLINWPDFEPLESKMQKLLGLSIHERPIMLIAIGYADEDPVPRSTKKELDTIRRYNFES